MMQDSVEDYIKLANNVGTEKSESNEKEYKVTFDARALKIVDFAIDGQLRPEVFTKCLNYINPSFYQDIVEERFLVEHCGYPICGRKILHRPNKQFFISTKANKVYDITERKNFCSNFCYKASNHIKGQIHSSPLCLRTEETCPKFQLLLFMENGSPGEEVLSINKNADETVFASVSDFAEASLDEAGENELTTDFKRLVLDQSRRDRDLALATAKKTKIADKHTKKNKHQEDIAKISKSTMENKKRCQLVNDVKTEVVETCKNLDKRLRMALEKVKKREDGVKHKPILIQTSRNPERKLQLEQIEKHEKKRSREEIRETNLEQNDTGPINIDNIFHSFTTWITLDTFLFLHGESVICSMLTERKLTDLFYRLRITEQSITQQIRYRDICRRMHMQDMMEKLKDLHLMDRSEGKRYDRKPLPEYGELKNESKELTVKVKAFLSGTLYDSSSSNIKTETVVVNENLYDSTGGYKTEEELQVNLPLSENSSHSAIRRRIFLNSANPQVRKHLLALNLEGNFMEQIQNLIHTFQLSAKNIVFKPKEWKLIGIALVEILSIRNEDLHNYIKREPYINYIKSEFSNITDFDDFIRGVIDYLQNVELFVELYMTSDK